MKKLLTDRSELPPVVKVSDVIKKSTFKDIFIITEMIQFLMISSKLFLNFARITKGI